MTTLPPRELHSDYMHFAKTMQSAKYNLAISGMISYPLAELPVKIEDLEINGQAGYGYPPLLEAIAKKCGVRAENVVSTLGTSMANYITLSALLNPGDEVLFEQPTYGLITTAAGFGSAKITRFPRHAENGFRLDPDEVKKAITPRTKMIVITNLHNPSSDCTPPDVLKQVGEIAQRVGAHVLVDEVYMDAMFDDAPPSAFHLGPNFIITNSLTKVYGLSGIRCGWVLAQPDIARRLWGAVDLMYGIQAHPAEQIGAIALQNLEKVRQRSKRILTANHAAVDAFLRDRDDLIVTPQKYGTVLFPCPKYVEVEALCDLLRHSYDTTIVPGRFFEMPEHFRLGLCGEPEMVKEGLARLGKALTALKR